MPFKYRTSSSTTSTRIVPPLVQLIPAGARRGWAGLGGRPDHGLDPGHQVVDRPEPFGPERPALGGRPR